MRALRRPGPGAALTTAYDDREAAAYERVVTLFGHVDPGTVVGDGTWTARDVLAHLVTVARRYTTMPRLGETPREVDVINAEELAELRHLEVPELLEQLAAGFEGYRALWTQMPADHEWPFHGGGRLSTTAVRTNWLGELLVHGWDVATAAGAEWAIGDEDGADLLAFLREVLPAYGHPGAPLTVRLEPNGTPSWALVVDGDGLRAGDGGTDADAVVGGGTGSLALLLYQRVALSDVAAHGLRVDGDAGALPKLFQVLERP